MSATWTSVLSKLKEKCEYTGDTNDLAAVKSFVELKNLQLTDGPGGPAIDFDALHAAHVADEAKKAARQTIAIDDTPVPGRPAVHTSKSRAAVVDAQDAGSKGNSRMDMTRKMYNIKANAGRTAFGDAEEMESFNAAIRVRTYELYANSHPSAFAGYKGGGFLDQDRDILSTKDASDSLLTAGGALLANYLKSETLWATEEWGVSRWIARNEIMYGNNTSFSRKTALPTFAPLSSGAVQASDISYDLVTLIPKQGGVLILTPLVLFEQTATALGDTIAESIMEAYWNTIDDIYFNGTGTSTYFGQNGLANGLTGTALSTTSGSYITASNAAVTSWVQADYLSAMSAVKNVNTSRCCWVMSRQHFIGGPLRLATALSGNRADNLLTPQNTYMVPAQQRGDAPAGPKAYLYGEPVYFCQRMNTTTASDANKIKAYYGDFVTGSIIGHRTGLEIASSTNYAFNKRALTTRGFAEWAINICGDGRATSSECGPIAALQSA